jgi:PQQ-dependent dehydrogenase (methanol/ethanol family)
MTTQYKPAIIFMSVAQFCFGPALAQDSPINISPVTDAMLQDPDPADWLMWRRTLDSWGYSPLDQINRDNIQNLTLAWSRPLGDGIQEGTPLVHDGVMFMPNPSDLVQAIDAATGDLIWEYRRKVPDDITDFLPFPSINRNMAIYGNVLIDTSVDNQLFAIDARIGKLVWETVIHDYRKNPSQHSSGPIIANGKVISGRGCQPKAGPKACVITAHDATDGKELWRTPTIQSRVAEDDSWGEVPYEGRWHVGAWLVPSYDPDLNLVYVGTSVSSPAPKFLLGGNDKQHLYHNSTLALDADSGEIVWYYQHLIDHWDLDHTYERLLVDTAVVPDPDTVLWINPDLRPGEVRKVMTGIPGKTGIVYTLDRETGEFLWATPTIEQNVVADIDGATGAVTVNPDMVFEKPGDRRFVCPGSTGGKNWMAGAYSPLTNTMYYPLQNVCMVTTAIIEEPTLESLYGIARRNQIMPGTEHVGTVQAISAETGKIVWKYEQRAGTTSLVATGGGLIFGGDVNGRFRAIDQETGESLWETNLGSQVTGYSISYAADGRQFVAVSTGNAPAAGSFLALTPELRPGAANNLFVFALPKKK